MFKYWIYSWLEMEMFQRIVFYTPKITVNYKEIIIKYMCYLWSSKLPKTVCLLLNIFSLVIFCIWMCNFDSAISALQGKCIWLRLFGGMQYVRNCSVYETFAFVALSLFLRSEMGTDSEVAGRPGLPVLHVVICCWNSAILK